MEHLDFSIFSNAVNNKFLELSSNKNLLAVKSKISGDELYQTYLKSYPKEVNTIFRERQHYDGNYDKNYIRRIGNIIFISKDGVRTTIWDVTLPGYFQQVADKLHLDLISSECSSLFLTDQPTAGSVETKDNINPEITWTHFYSSIPKHLLSISVEKDLGDFNTNVDLFKRGLTELSLSSMLLVKELIEANSLYRGTEHLLSLNNFIKLKEEYDSTDFQEEFVWTKSKELGFTVRFKNSVIGTLVDDLSKGIELEKAVKSFESKVAPQNYKRTSSLITPKMVEQAQEKLTELNLLDSIQRRFATASDLSVENVLFKYSPVKPLNVFDDLKKESSKTLNKKKLDKVISDITEISIQEFLTNILPTVNKLEVLVENKHVGNLMSLVTEVHKDSPTLFKWNNPFSWSYNGEIADSALRSKVQALGGRVDGVLRFSHTWNYNPSKPNQSLMDLHVFFPGYVNVYKDKKEVHNSYPNCRRVGWNKRRDMLSGGSQDVDFVNPPGTNVPVENITFPSLDKLPNGVYTFKIHNWENRAPTTSGFKAEIEFGGEVFEYEVLRPLGHHEWITLAEVTLKDGVFTIDHKLPVNTSNQEVWGISTNTFVEVTNLCLSPNYWGDNEVGNKHLFFILDQCKNPLVARGFYNEFLRTDLEQHRKVFEMLADKTKTDLSEEQLSGLGFSSTKKDSVIVRISGKTQQTFKLNF